MFVSSFLANASIYISELDDKAQIEDVELVRRARTGDIEAFEKLLGRHQQRVLRVVLSIVK